MDLALPTMFPLLFVPNERGRFYVYILYRPNGRPFYVGKGCGDRIKNHEREARRGCKCYKCRTIRKIWDGGGTVDRQIVFTTDDELLAFRTEANLIQRFRSELTNIADFDGRIWQLVKHRPPRKSRRQRQIERYADAQSAIRNLERKLRRAVLIRDYAAQEQIDAQIEAYMLLIRPPIQLRLEGF